MFKFVACCITILGIIVGIVVGLKEGIQEGILWGILTFLLCGGVELAAYYFMEK